MSSPLFSGFPRVKIYVNIFITSLRQPRKLLPDMSYKERTKWPICKTGSIRGVGMDIKLRVKESN